MKMTEIQLLGEVGGSWNFFHSVNYSRRTKSSHLWWSIHIFNVLSLYYMKRKGVYNFEEAFCMVWTTNDLVARWRNPFIRRCIGVRNIGGSEYKRLSCIDESFWETALLSTIWKRDVRPVAEKHFEKWTEARYRTLSTPFYFVDLQCIFFWGYFDTRLWPIFTDMKRVNSPSHHCAWKFVNYFYKYC